MDQSKGDGQSWEIDDEEELALLVLGEDLGGNTEEPEAEVQEALGTLGAATSTPRAQDSDLGQRVVAILPERHPEEELSKSQANRVFGRLLEQASEADVNLAIPRKGWMNGGLILTIRGEVTANWLKSETEKGRFTSEGRRHKMTGRGEVEKKFRVIMAVSEGSVGLSTVLKQLQREHPRSAARGREFILRINGQEVAYLREQGMRIKLWTGCGSQVLAP